MHPRGPRALLISWVGGQEESCCRTATRKGGPLRSPGHSHGNQYLGGAGQALGCGHSDPWVCVSVETCNVGVLLDSCHCKAGVTVHLGPNGNMPVSRLLSVHHSVHVTSAQASIWKMEVTREVLQSERQSLAHHLCQGRPSPFPASPPKVGCANLNFGRSSSSPS